MKGLVCEDDFTAAVFLVSRVRRASVSMLQRRLRLTYKQASEMIERLEAEGIVGPAGRDMPREVLVRRMPEVAKQLIKGRAVCRDCGAKFDGSGSAEAWAKLHAAETGHSVTLVEHYQILPKI